jgi:signal transduction histidine kinase
MIHAMLRPLTQRLRATLSQLERARDPAAGPGPDVRRATQRRRQAIEDTSRELRRPLSVLAGLTEYYRHHDQLGPAGLDRLLDRVAEETARIGALVETLERTGQDQPGPPGPGENVGGSA